MEISQLRYFLQVADKLSFSKAADELGISQPGLSRAIGKLEESLGQPVFERQSRNLALTDAGNLLLARANKIIALVDDTVQEIIDQSDSGQVRLGAIPTIAPYFLPGLLAEFSKASPNSRVIVQEDTTEPTLHRCKQGDLDLAIVALPVQQKYMEAEALFDDELLLVLPRNHPLENAAELTLDDLQPFPFVLLDEAHCLAGNIMTFCQQKSFDPVATERISQLATVQELVSLNHGVSLIPAMAAVRDQDSRRSYLRLAEHPARTIAMVWNPYRYQSRVVERLKSCIRAFAKNFSQSCGGG